MQVWCYYQFKSQIKNATMGVGGAGVVQHYKYSKLHERLEQIFGLPLVV